MSRSSRAESEREEAALKEGGGRDTEGLEAENVF